MCARSTGEGIVKQIELFLTSSGMTKNEDDCKCVEAAAVEWEDSCASGCNCRVSPLDPFHKHACACPVTSWATVQDQKLFSAIHCKILKEVEKGIAANKSASWITAQLGSVQDLAYQLHCYHFSTPSLAAYYVNEALKLTKDIELWSPTSSKIAYGPYTQSFNEVHELAAMVKTQGEMLEEQRRMIMAQQRQIDALIAQNSRPSDHPAVQSGSCKPSSTAFECWTAAFQALDTATALVRTTENQTRATEQKFESSFQMAEKALAAAQTNFTSAQATFLNAAKNLFLQKKGPQTYEGDLTFKGGSTVDLTDGSGMIKSYKADIDTLTGHAYGSTSGKDGRIRVTLDGKDSDLPGYLSQKLNVGLCDCHGKDVQDGMPGGYMLVDYTSYCDAGCDGGFQAIGIDSGRPQLSICKPCLHADGSYERLPKSQTKSKCKPDAKRQHEVLAIDA